MKKSKRQHMEGAIWPNTSEGLAHAVLLCTLVDLIAGGMPEGFRERLLSNLEETLERTTFDAGIGTNAMAEVKADALGRLRTLIADPKAARH